MDTSNTTLNNNDELALMREQMAQLKQRLDRTTLNEQHMLDAIKRKMRRMHRTVYKIIAVALLACPLWVVLGYSLHLSWYFIAFTVVMLLASAIADYLINRMDVDSMQHNMADTARRLVRMKKLRLRQECIAIPVAVAWFAWLIWEYLHMGADPEAAVAMAVGALIGAAVGGVIGVRIFLSLQRANDDMLRSIQDLQDEEK